jgi:hypothetical protein
VTAAILSLTERLRPGTIDPLLEKSDIEVVPEFSPTQAETLETRTSCSAKGR